MDVEIDRHESALGTWTSASWMPLPGSPLHGAVSRIWFFDGTLIERKERVFPDGTIELIVQLDRPHSPADAEASPFPPVCLSGLRLSSEVVLAPPGRCRVLGVVLFPPAACALIADSLALVTGKTIDLCDAIGTAAYELAHSIDGVKHPAQAVHAARRWLSLRLCAAPQSSRNFRDRFGTTPKRYDRILRFHRALESLAGGVMPLAEVAGAFGYYDQSHFTNEFREHAGMTPGAFLRSRRFPAGLSVADGP